MMNAPSGLEHVVKKSKFTEEQIAFAFKQAELGTRVEEVCRKIRIDGNSQQYFFSRLRMMSIRQSWAHKMTLVHLPLQLWMASTA